jgi:hypothetical protein
MNPNAWGTEECWLKVRGASQAPSSEADAGMLLSPSFVVGASRFINALVDLYHYRGRLWLVPVSGREVWYGLSSRSAAPF